MYRVADGPPAAAAGNPFRPRTCCGGWRGIQGARGLGIGAGDRVGLFAPNCPEWHIADFAIQGLGAVTVPIYFNESPERMTYILKDSGARIVVISQANRKRGKLRSAARSCRASST